MKRRLGLATAAIALCAGCRSPAPVYDPFLGRTTIEPPATAMPPPGQPYYGAPAGVSAPFVTPPPGTSPVPARPAGQQNFIPAPAGGGGLSSFSPNVSSPQPTLATPPRGTNSNTLTPVSSRPSPSYAPPGGAGYPQASSSVPGGSPTLAQGNPALAAQPNLPAPLDVDRLLASRGASGAVASAASGVAPAVNWETADANRSGATASPATFTSPSPSQRSIIRIVEPPSAGSAATNPSTGQGNFNGSRVPEISELPPAYSGTARAATVAPRTTIAQPATQQWATTPGVTSSITPATNTSPEAKPTGVFGYDPQYRTLRGKLEYSESTRQWRLRYIPPDGATDDYGGSVVLADAAKLQGLQPGDLVRAEGSVGATSGSARSFAPLYNLERIQKQ